MLNPERVVEIVAGVRQSHPEVVQVFWHQRNDQRQLFCDRIAEVRQQLPIFALPLRGAGFTDPNAVAEDIVRLLERYRDVFDAFDWSSAAKGKVSIIIVSRTGFTLPQAPSPATFPDWFPYVGGQVVPVLVQDLESTVEARLDVAETAISEVRSAVYTLELALVARLEKNQHNRRALDALAGILLGEGEKFNEVLSGAQRYLTSISDPRGYRPSLGKAVSLTGRLLRIVAGSSPDQLPRKAGALMTALGLTDTALIQVPESVPALLSRPSTPIDARDRQMRFGLNLLQTLYAAHQLSTAVAHAGDYPAYPLLLLRAMSMTILDTLARLELAIVLDQTTEHVE